MTEFWIAVVGLLIAAFIIVLWPWFKHARIEATARQLDAEERARVNVRIFKDRMRELSAEKAAGKIDDEGFVAIKDELEKTLLQDVEGDGSAASSSGNQGINEASKNTFVVMAAIAVFVCLGSFFLYERWGAYDQVVQYHDSRFNEQELALAEELAAAGDTRGLLVQLRDKLRQSPDNAEGWSLLARSAMNSENFDIAIESYDQLVQLEPETATKAVLYGLKAQALYFSRASQARIDQAIESAFSLNPEELNALGLLAIASYENKDYPSAIAFWEQTLSIAPDHPSRKSIEMGIQSAKSAMAQDSNSQPPEVNAGSGSDNATRLEPQSVSGKTVQVQLSIDEGVLSKLNGEEILVVFAKASEGPPMPLAVYRGPAGEAPSMITLDDNLAMMPSLKLSLFDQVDIVARITKGSVERANGDFEVISQGVSLSNDEAVKVSLQLSLGDQVFSK